MSIKYVAECFYEIQECPCPKENERALLLELPEFFSELEITIAASFLVT
jgi:hypothetical protein